MHSSVGENIRTYRQSIILSIYQNGIMFSSRAYELASHEFEELLMAPGIIQSHMGVP